MKPAGQRPEVTRQLYGRVSARGREARGYGRSTWASGSSVVEIDRGGASAFLIEAFKKVAIPTAPSYTRWIPSPWNHE